MVNRDSFRLCQVILTTAVEFEGSLESDALLWSGSFGIRSLCGVKCVYIGLMMFGVMKNHDLFRDMRFKSIVGIFEGGKSVCHGE